MDTMRATRLLIPAVVLATACGGEPAGGLTFAGPPPTTADALLIEAERVPGLQSLLSKRGDTMIVEGYFRGMNAEKPVHLRSATKSVTSKNAASIGATSSISSDASWRRDHGALKRTHRRHRATDPREPRTQESHA